MDWYIVQITPEALRKARKHWFEAGPKDGRYKRSEELEYTNLSDDCARLQVEHYVPVEREKAIHRRTKALIERELPLIPGYAFVRDVTDFKALSELPSVHAVLIDSVLQTPLRIRDKDVEKVKAVEAKRNRIYEEQLANEQALRERKEFFEDKISRAQLQTIYPQQSNIQIVSGLMKGLRGVVVSCTGRKTVHVLVDSIKAEFTIDQIEILT